MEALIRFIKLFRPLVPEHIRPVGHFVVAEAGALLYGLPSRGMLVVGVTGTNGKSTVVALLHHVFNKTGLRVASLSSLRENINGTERARGEAGSAKNTMPGWFDLQRFFRRAKKAGCQVVIVEVTSEGIKQYRHRGIFFDRAVITNLQPEHIESHGSFEAYRDTKGKLFTSLHRWKPGVSTASIVNLDDPSAYYYIHFEADEKWGFGVEAENGRGGVKAVIPSRVNVSTQGISFDYGGLTFTSELVGDFNVSNMLCALAVALSFRLPLADIRDALSTAPAVPGRLEVIAEKPRVIIDYAHTPDALEGVYRNVRELWLPTKGRLIAVLGAAGGGRDKWKRPEFGRIASRQADLVVLTNEDPYDEDPEAIVAEIAHGIEKTPFEIIIDRRDAIAHALAQAGPGDVVVITGKGAEQAMQTGAGAVSWDDREVVKDILNNRS